MRDISPLICHRRKCATALVVTFIASTISCTRQSIPLPAANASQPGQVPGQFSVKKKLYILSQSRPGIIEDDSVRYTADAGARTIDFGTHKVLRDLFVERVDAFLALGPDEQRELSEVASGALEFIQQIEKEQALSGLNQEHRRILLAFLQETQSNRETGSK